MSEEDLLLDNFYLKKQKVEKDNRMEAYHRDTGTYFIPPEPATHSKNESYNEFIQSHFT